MKPEKPEQPTAAFDVPSQPKCEEVKAFSPLSAPGGMGYANFPTFVGGAPLKRFRISAPGKPTLEGRAINEEEAIKAYEAATAKSK